MIMPCYLQRIINNLQTRREKQPTRTELIHVEDFVFGLSGAGWCRRRAARKKRKQRLLMIKDFFILQEHME